MRDTADLTRCSVDAQPALSELHKPATFSRLRAPPRPLLDPTRRRQHDLQIGRVWRPPLETTRGRTGLGMAGTHVLSRSRWAAAGAAVAVTLGAGGIGFVRATSPSGAATFVPITPCRILDTRPTSTVGAKSSPFGPGEIVTVVAHGDPGACTGIPNTATGVSLNVTTVDASSPTFLTIWPTGEDRPEASSLNPSPGQPPTPNAVSVALSSTGEFDIFNLQGTVHVLADLNGYYTDHDHDDRYYTEAEVDARYYTRAELDDRYYTQADVDARFDADVPRLETVTEHVSCTGAGFTLDRQFADSEQGIISNNGRWIGGTVAGSANGVSCPVSPPDGARLVSARFDLSDSYSVQGIDRVEVRRWGIGTTDSQGVITRYPESGDLTGTSDTPGRFTAEFPIAPTDPSRAIVDTGNYGYELMVVMGPSNPSSGYLAIYGASLTYEIERWTTG